MLSTNIGAGADGSGYGDDNLPVHFGFDGSDADDGTNGVGDIPNASKKAFKQRAKRKRKQIETMMTKVMGGDIDETRANA